MTTRTQVRRYYRDQAIEYARAALAFHELTQRQDIDPDVRDDWIRSAIECQRLAVQAAHDARAA